MLTLPDPLPPSILLDEAGDDLIPELDRENAVWFRADASNVTLDGSGEDASVSEWKSNRASVSAIPSRPNEGQGRHDSRQAPGRMLFQPRINCGYAASDISSSAERFSLAVIYSSPSRDARTLVSVSSAGGKNIFFVSETGDEITLKDRSNGMELIVPNPDHELKTNLIILSVTPRRVWARVGLGPVAEARGTITGMTDPATLFIGCRSHRPGLAKTLGEHAITDVFFWPETQILAPADHPTPRAGKLVHEFWRWHRA